METTALLHVNRLMLSCLVTSDLAPTTDVHIRIWRIRPKGRTYIETVLENARVQYHMSYH